MDRVLVRRGREGTHGATKLAPTATLSWVGPPPADRIQATAVSVLSDYLCQPTIGVLSKKFVDCEDPICESIYGVQSASSPIIITFHLDSVSSDRLESVCREVKNTITQVRRQLYSKTGDDGIKERLHELIDQTRRGILVDNEDNAREALGGCTQLCTSDLTCRPQWLQAHLESTVLQFGELDCADLAEVYLTAVWPYNVLEKWTSKQWADALAWYDAPALMLLGKPSAKLAAELGREEKQRQQDSISQYIKEHPGSTPQDAKAAFAREIAAAREAFKPAPEELLKALPVADGESQNLLRCHEADTHVQRRASLGSLSRSPATLRRCSQASTKPFRFTWTRNSRRTMFPFRCASTVSALQRGQASYFTELRVQSIRRSSSRLRSLSICATCTPARAPPARATQHSATLSRCIRSYNACSSNHL